MLRALCAAMFALLAIVPATAALGTPTASTGELTAVEVVDRVGSAVVTVINEQTVGTLDTGQQLVPVGAGTGFIIDDEGHIVTNWHVVTGGTSYSVILADGTQLDATLIGQDPRDDLAVVQIDASMVPATVPLGDSDQLQQGQTVLAMGSPLGAFGNTVTQGIVSGLNRNEFIESGQGAQCQNYTDLIQHDAAINPGNSGGPLFNLRGEVVGVNTLGIPQENGTPVQGLFFAVPSNTVKEVVNEILTVGHVSVPYIGASIAELNPQISAANNLPVDHGAYIASVQPGTGAADAGLQEGDIILSIDGEEITVDTTLSQLLTQYNPGDTVTLNVLRNGEESTVDLTFGEVPQELFEQCTLQGAG